MFTQSLLRRTDSGFLFEPARFADQPEQWLVSGLGVVDVLLGLLVGLLGLGLGISVRIERSNRCAEAQSLACGCAFGAGICANGFKSHVAHQRIDVDSQVMRYVDRSHARPKVREVRADLLWRSAGWE